jgi:hypothetical protein
LNPHSSSGSVMKYQLPYLFMDQLPRQRLPTKQHTFKTENFQCSKGGFIVSKQEKHKYSQNVRTLELAHDKYTYVTVCLILTSLCIVDEEQIADMMTPSKWSVVSKREILYWIIMLRFVLGVLIVYTLFIM